MNPKKGTKVLTELLNIQGIKVTKMNQLPGIGIILQVESMGASQLCNEYKYLEQKYDIIER